MQARDSIESNAAGHSSIWSPPTGALGALMEASAVRAATATDSLRELRARAADLPPARPFAGALRRATVAVIAEIKRASPTKGDIAPGLDAVAQAEAYVRGGAAAISVLTEPSRFGGSLEDLRAVSESVAVPIIRKDFICRPVQLWEARVAGAAAVLLIARGLAPTALEALYAEALGAGLGVLLEVRDPHELELALALGATVIGVNNRNLETLQIDPATAPALIPAIPASVVAVAESGMSGPDDARAAQAAGADALLIGSAISAAANPAAAVAAFTALGRQHRGRNPV